MHVPVASLADHPLLCSFSNFHFRRRIPLRPFDGNLLALSLLQLQTSVDFPCFRVALGSDLIWSRVDSLGIPGIRIHTKGVSHPLPEMQVPAFLIMLIIHDDQRYTTHDLRQRKYPRAREASLLMSLGSCAVRGSPPHAAQLSAS